MGISLNLKPKSNNKTKKKGIIRSLFFYLFKLIFRILEKVIVYVLVIIIIIGVIFYFNPNIFRILFGF